MLCAGTGSSLDARGDTHGETPPRAWPQRSRPLHRDGPGAEGQRPRSRLSVPRGSLTEEATAGVLAVISFPASLL